MWPKEYIQLKHIEDLLLCGICYDFMDTPVITSCSHSYCSLCIRKYLHYKTQCPACFSETFEKDLRKNKTLDEIIKYFQLIKDKLKRTLEIYIQFSNRNEDRFPDEHNDIMGTQTSISYTDEVNKLQNSIIDRLHNTPTKKNRVLSPKSFPSDIGMKTVVSPSTSYLLTNQTSSPSPSTSNRTRIPLMFTPKSKKRIIPTNVTEDGKNVVCPVCKVLISEIHINKHLDDCLKRESTEERPQIFSKSTRKPLPKLVFNLMKDAVIKKKLKEYGLPVQGDRKAMENRLQRYIILYNAECDKSMPRSVAELVKQCEEEENLEKKINKTTILNKLQVTRNTDENVIELERKKYLNAHKGSFENLIKNIKRTKTADSSPKKASMSHHLLENEKENNCDNIHPQTLEKNKLTPKTIVEDKINESINESSDDSGLVPCTPNGGGYDKINCYFTVQDSDSETSLKDNAEKDDSRKKDLDEDNNVSLEKGNVNGKLNSSYSEKATENNLDASFSLVNFENFAKQNFENIEDETVEGLDEVLDNSPRCSKKNTRSFRKRGRETSSQLLNSKKKVKYYGVNMFDEEDNESVSFIDNLPEEERKSIYLTSLLVGESEKNKNNLEASLSLVNSENFAKQNFENIKDETAERLDEVLDNSPRCSEKNTCSFRTRSRESSSQLSNSKEKVKFNDVSIIDEEEDLLKSLLEGVSEEIVPENKTRTRKRKPNQSTENANRTTRRTSRRNVKK